MKRFGTNAERPWRGRMIAPLTMLLGLWAAQEGSAAPIPAEPLRGGGSVASAQYYGPRFGITIRPPVYRAPVQEPYYEEEEEYVPPPRPRRPVVRIRPAYQPRAVVAAPVRAERIRVAPKPRTRTVVIERTRARARIRLRAIETARAPVRARPRVVETARASARALPRTVARVERPRPPPVDRAVDVVRVERVRPPPPPEVFVPRGESTGGGNLVPRRGNPGPQVGDIAPRGESTGTAPSRPSIVAQPPRGDSTGGGPQRPSFRRARPPGGF